MTTVLCISSLLLFLVGPSSARFQTTNSILPLGGTPGIWRGNPAVEITRGQEEYRICADDTYWNDTVADTVCQYFGFEGAMIIQEDVPVGGSELDGYVVCKIIEVYSILESPLSCELTDVCDSVPTISCFLPGYRGCYSHTEASPFFPSGVTAPVDRQPYDILTCAASCPDYPYLGLTASQVCICGSELGTGDEGVCNTTCLADDLQACGGDTAISTYGANVIGRCNPEQVDLPPRQPYYITSPKFPGSYTPGEACTWVMDMHNVPPPYNVDFITAHDLNANTTDIIKIILSGPKAITTLFIFGEPGTARANIDNDVHVRDTLAVEFKTNPNATDQPGAGFSIRILLNLEPPTTDAPTPTSHAGKNLNMSKLAISAGIGLVLFAVLLV